MTRLVFAFLALSSGLMALLLFLIVVFSTALLIFSGRGKKEEARIQPLMELEETTS
jgi:cytochrome c biogenesis factor